MDMKKWFVLVPDAERHIGYTKDHLVHRLCIRTDLNEAWTLRLDVQHGDACNVIALERKRNVLYVDLTRAMLLQDGQYAFQVRGTCGEQVGHSNVFFLYVSGSINAENAFPEPLPSEFAQMEARLTQLAQDAEGYSTNPPRIGGNGNWFVYDGLTYTDTCISARGQTPYIGKNGNWWIGATDTGVYASGGGTVQVITNEELEELLQ